MSLKTILSPILEGSSTSIDLGTTNGNNISPTYIVQDEDHGIHEFTDAEISEIIDDMFKIQKLIKKNKKQLDAIELALYCENKHNILSRICDDFNVNSDENKYYIELTESKTILLEEAEFYNKTIKQLQKLLL
jgi:hypothetical protein